MWNSTGRLLASAATVLSCLSSLGHAQCRQVYVSDGSSATAAIYVVDAETGTLLRTIPTPTINPNGPDGVALSRDGQSLLVVEDADFHLIDLDGTVLSSFTLAGIRCESPVALNDGRYAVLQTSPANEVILVDPFAQSSTTAFSTGASLPVGIESDGVHLWLLFLSDPTIYRYDLAGNVLDSLALSNAPGNPLAIAWRGDSWIVGSTSTQQFFEYDLNGNQGNAYSVPGAFLEGLEMAADTTNNGSFQVDQLQFVVDWSQRFVDSGIAPDAFAAKGTLDVDWFETNQNVVPSMDELVGAFYLGTQGVEFGFGVVDGSRIFWENSTAGFEIDLRKGTWACRVENVDLVQALGVQPPQGPSRGQPMDVTLSFHAGMLHGVTTLQALVKSAGPGRPMTGQWKSGKPSFVHQTGTFAVEKAKIQQRTKNGVNEQRAQFTLAFRTPGDMPYDPASIGVDLAIGTYGENVGDGGLPFVFQGSGSKWTYKNRQADASNAIAAMSFDARKGQVKITTTWVPVGNFLPNLEVTDVETDPTLVFLPLSFDIDGVRACTTFSLGRSATTWSTR
ncbi:MAG: hypothetical protein H6834_10350 [Planctomycetes bacterium]|nr:hypothetical protein [Planctomycetota bacterium]